MSLPLDEVVDVQFSKSNGGKGFTPNVPLECIMLSNYEYSIVADDDPVQLVVLYIPNNATERGMVWESSDPDVITVDELGFAKPLAEGVAYVTGTSVDGGYTVRAKFNVARAPILVESVTVSPTSVTLEEGKTQQLTYTYLPANADEPEFYWISDDESVATVSDTGLVTAVGDGETTVNVQYGVDSTIFDTCTITVIPPVVHVTGVEFLTQSPLNVNIGNTAETSIRVSPEDATDKTVTYESSAPAVATVDNDGKVTGVTAGNAIVTVKTTDGDKTDTLDIIVNVPVINVTGVSIDEGATASMETGDTLQLHATVTPPNATDPSVVWSAPTSAVATVTEAGLVTANAVGSIDVTVTTNDGGFSDVITISVGAAVVHPTGVTIDQGESIKVVKGETSQLTATVAPAEATNKNVTWESDTPAVATVSADGLVTGVEYGTAIITVSTVDGNKTDTISVEVPTPASLATDSFPSDLLVGNKVQLTYTTDPANSPLTDIEYYTTDDTIATVDGTGLVSLIKEGSARIGMRAKSYGSPVSDDSGLYASELSVYTDSLSAMTVGGPTQTIGIGSTTPAWVLTDPATVITFTTTDPGVATVDEHTGVITAVASGGCRIGATVTNGDVSGSDSSYLSVD
ncbi:major tail protein [Salmonella phage SE13]|uniref:Major tail protein n=1 Tax=Salmonella phage SE13 TaxID=2575325 RepID=A0A513ZWS8_9CAUD|nr:major tail protein [Salmonella phage SE13]QDH45139.1 major tail protein [Salmonella phage SE13]